MSLCLIHLLLRADALNWHLKYLSVTKHCHSYFTVNTLGSAACLSGEQRGERLYKYYMILHYIVLGRWSLTDIIGGNNDAPFGIEDIGSAIHGSSRIRQQMDRKPLY